MERTKVAFFLDGYGNRRHYIQLEALKEIGLSPLIITFQDPKPGYLLEKGIDKDILRILPFKRSEAKKGFSLKMAKYLLNLIREEKIVPILTHRYKLLRYLIFCKLFHPSLRIIFHLVIRNEINGWHQRIFFKLFRSKIDKILVNSLALKEELVQKGLAKEEEIEIFYSGIDLQEFNFPYSKDEARRRFSLDQKGFYFGMVAQFRKEKDQKGAIRALKLLLDRGYKAKLILAGDGPKLEECKALAKSLGLEEEVIFLGKIPPVEIPYLLKALDVFVLASFREGMPLAILEAMASSLPIIATAVEGIPDIFQKGKPIGEMVPLEDVESLAQAMIKILNLSEGERSLLGEEAKKLITENFSSKNLKIRTQELFQSLLPKV